MRKFILMTITAAALAVGTFSATPAQAAPIAPDEWHCLALPAAGDELCLHLNQFLGWWTGFSAEYRHRSGSWVTVRLHWSSTQGQSGALPAPDRVHLLHSGEYYHAGSWADLPSFACISVVAQEWWPNGFSTTTDPITVCRDN